MLLSNVVIYIIYTKSHDFLVFKKQLFILYAPSNEDS